MDNKVLPISHPDHGFWAFMAKLATILATAAPAIAAAEGAGPNTQAEVTLASELAKAALERSLCGRESLQAAHSK